MLVSQLDRTESALRSAEALRLARELHDPLLLTRATYVRAAYELRCGDDLPQARRLLEETLARHDEAGRRDPEFLVATRLSLAAVLLRDGDTERAAALCAQCAEMCDRCAAECGSHELPICRQCASHCTRCAQSCRAVVTK